MNDVSFDERLWAHYPPILRPVDRSRHRLHGLSGSVVWKVATEAGHIAVRQFPTRRRPSTGASLQPFFDFPPGDHRPLILARLHDWAEVPQPLANTDVQTFTKHDDYWWDVCTWQPGEPSRLPIDGPRLQAAMHFIARWHAFWNRDNLGISSPPPRPDSVANRRSEWERLHLGWHAQAVSAGMLKEQGRPDSCPRLQLGHATPKHDPLGLAERVARTVKARALRIDEQFHELASLLATEPMVLCHGDLHREHILFTDERVTGFIDLSCRWDFAAADLARWLSTTTAPNRWPQAVAWYREVARLSAASERAIPLLAETGWVIAALRWERWLFGPEQERRYFPRIDLAYDRWRVVVERLEGGEL